MRCLRRNQRNESHDADFRYPTITLSGSASGGSKSRGKQGERSAGRGRSSESTLSTVFIVGNALVYLYVLCHKRDKNIPIDVSGYLRLHEGTQTTVRCVRPGSYVHRDIPG